MVLCSFARRYDDKSIVCVCVGDRIRLILSSFSAHRSRQLTQCARTNPIQKTKIYRNKSQNLFRRFGDNHQVLFFFVGLPIFAENPLAADNSGLYYPKRWRHFRVSVVFNWIRFGCRVCAALPIFRCGHRTPPLIGSYFYLELAMWTDRVSDSIESTRSQVVANTMRYLAVTNTPHRKAESINFNDNAETKDFRIIKLHLIRNLVSIVHHNDSDGGSHFRVVIRDRFKRIQRTDTRVK